MRHRHASFLRFVTAAGLAACTLVGLAARASADTTPSSPAQLLAGVGGAYAPWTECGGWPSAPTAVAVASDGTRYVAGPAGPACVGTIWKVTPWGSITLVTLDPNTVDPNGPTPKLTDYGTWSGNIGEPNHRPADQTALEDPAALTLDSNGDLFIADDNAHVVLMIDDTGLIWLVAGVPDQEGCVDGTCGGSTALGWPAVGDVANPIGHPDSVAVDEAGNLFIEDTDSGLLEVRASDDVLTLVAGYPYSCGYRTDGSNGDGGPADEACMGPANMGGIATDSAGNVYVDDYSNSCGTAEVHKIDMATGVISNFVGAANYGQDNLTTCYPGASPQDGAPADQAGQVGDAWTSLAFDANGDLYLADSYYEDIRVVDAQTHDITTVAGQTANPWEGWNGINWYGAAGFPALDAAIYPAFDTSCLAVAPDDTVLYCDAEWPTPNLYEVYQPLAEQAYDPDNGNTLTATFGSAGTATLMARPGDANLTPDPYSSPTFTMLSLRQPPPPDPGLIPGGQSFVLGVTYTHGANTPAQPYTLTITDPRIAAGENVYEVDTPQDYNQAATWTPLSDSSSDASNYAISGDTVTITVAGQPDSTDVDNEPRFVVTGALPIITVPTDLPSFPATSPGGANVDYISQVSATAADGSTLTPSCDPASGSLFPVGDTTVSCTATDTNNGLSATATFTVQVALPTGVSGQTNTGDSPAATVSDTSGSISGTSAGTGTLGVWEYASNPEDPVAPPGAVSKYFDVYAAGDLTSVSVTDCDLGAGNTVYWWNGTGWQPVSSATFDSGTGCVSFTLDGLSSPSVTELSGTVFAVGTSSSNSGGCSADSARGKLMQLQSCLGNAWGSAAWDSQPSGTSNDLSAVWSIDNNHAWAVGKNCTLVFTANAGVSWTKSPMSGQCSGDLTDVSVVDNGHGWAVGNGVVLVCTANCAQANATWAPLTGNPGVASTNFTGVWASGGTVYAVGQSSGSGIIWACAVGCNFATSWTGTTPPPKGTSVWTNVTPSGTVNALTSVTDPGGPAIAVGIGGQVWDCTKNCASSPSSWTASLSNSFSGTELSGVWQGDSNHALIVGGQKIWGCASNCDAPSATWTQVGSAPTAITAVSGAGAGVSPATAVGKNGLVLTCVNACNTNWNWTPQSPTGVTTSDVNLLGVDQSDPNHAWTVGSGGSIYGLINPVPSLANSLKAAATAVTAALDPSLWPAAGDAKADGNHPLYPAGGPVFDRSKDAVKALMAIKPQSDWTSDEQTFDQAARQVASVAIQENSCNVKNAGNLAKAKTEFANGDADFNAGHYDSAIDHYKNAWTNANQAMGTSSC